MIRDSLRIKLFVDDTEMPARIELSRNPRVHGFTANPSLMRQTDCERFGRKVLSGIPGPPISREVVADEFD